MVAGIAAVVMGEMTAQEQDYDPFVIKNVIMSTAADLGNDPFVQGAGLADAGTALDYVHGNGGVFVVDNEASYDNIREVLGPAIGEFNVTAAHVESFELPSLPASMTGWFCRAFGAGGARDCHVYHTESRRRGVEGRREARDAVAD